MPGVPYLAAAWAPLPSSFFYSAVRPSVGLLADEHLEADAADREQDGEDGRQNAEGEAEAVGVGIDCMQVLHARFEALGCRGQGLDAHGAGLREAAQAAVVGLAVREDRVLEQRDLGTQGGAGGGEGGVRGRGKWEVQRD